MDKKLLIIEDSKPIAKIHWHIARRIGLDATVAYSYAQTTQILEAEQDFFCAVVDYNLPDACNGEAIDYVVEAGIPVIVMTGMTNNEVRDAILRRSVIDYIPKGNKQAYQYLQQLLTQLLRNENIKVLVVDDSAISRSYICNQLYRHNYQVYEAVDGFDALRVLEEHDDIKLVITDQEMPNMDGITLTEHIRQKRSKEGLAIIGISGSSDNSLTARFIKSGANDYLHKPFCTEEFNCRLMHNIEYIENIETIRQQTNKVEKHNKDMAVLSEIGREITSSLELEQILNKIYRHVNSLMDAHVFSLGLYRPEQELIEFKVNIVGGQWLSEYTLPMGKDDCLAVWCIRNGKEVILSNTQDHLHYIDHIADPCSEVNTEALIYQPLLVQERLIGCLSVQSVNINAYSDYQLDMVRTISSYAAIALDNAEVHRKLKESQNQLVMQEKMASLGTLTAGVAHEINNPTNFAHVSAQNLEVDLQRFQTFLFSLVGDEAEQEILDSFTEKFEPLFKHLATIKDGTERIKGIVKDLQAFTRHDDRGKNRVRVVECLQSTIKLVQAKYRETAEFAMDFTFDPEIMCWPAQLNQVFMNLLVNACQAILYKQQHKQQQDDNPHGLVNIQTFSEEENVVIAISDNGCGMDQVILSKLFEPFFTTKEVGEGTGLGLSISFGIIKKHQGDILVESILGQGSTFIIKLPCLAN